MIEAEGTSADRYAPPQAHVEDVVDAFAEGPVLAGRGRRLAAVLIDGGIAMAIMMLLAAFTPFNPLAAASRGLGSGLGLSALVNFTAFLLVHGWLLVNRGQTVGKAAMGVRIVRVDGSRASAWELFGKRYGLTWILGLIPVAGRFYALADCLFIFRASRRCLHDLLAGTIVVRA
jgi:uncharacterized RDD family membrane protein YckC